MRAFKHKFVHGNNCMYFFQWLFGSKFEFKPKKRKSHLLFRGGVGARQASQCCCYMSTSAGDGWEQSSVIVAVLFSFINTRAAYSCKSTEGISGSNEGSSELSENLLCLEVFPRAFLLLLFLLFNKRRSREQERSNSSGLRSSYWLEYTKKILCVSGHFPVVLLSTSCELPVSAFGSLRFHVPVPQKQR